MKMNESMKTNEFIFRFCLQGSKFFQRIMFLLTLWMQSGPQLLAEHDDGHFNDSKPFSKTINPMVTFHIPNNSRSVIRLSCGKFCWVVMDGKKWQVFSHSHGFLSDKRDPAFRSLLRSTSWNHKMVVGTFWLGIPHRTLKYTVLGPRFQRPINKRGKRLVWRMRMLGDWTWSQSRFLFFWSYRVSRWLEMESTWCFETA